MLAFAYIQGAPAESQPASVFLGIKIIFLLIPQIVTLISLFILWAYPIKGQQLIGPSKGARRKACPEKSSPGCSRSFQCRMNSSIEGTCDERFKPVADAFRQNFLAGKETGAIAGGHPRGRNSSRPVGRLHRRRPFPDLGAGHAGQYFLHHQDGHGPVHPAAGRPRPD